MSEGRVQSLVNKLVNEYGIDITRLRPVGVGPLAYEASDENEDGIAKNRKIELVKM